MKKNICLKAFCCLLAILFIVPLAGCDKGNNIGQSEPLSEQPIQSSSKAVQSIIEPSSQPASEPIEPPLSEQLLSSMSLDEKIAQLFIVAPEQLGNPGGEASLKYPVGGILLFANNIETPSQCTHFIESYQEASRIPLFVAVDEEGGMVSRIGKNSKMGTTSFPNMKKIKTTEEAFEVGSTIGSEIKQFGFNLDFAPVADVNSNPNNPIIGVRSFGSEPNHVAEQVESAVQGFHSSGMLCTLKHFPGHGDTDSDSHLGYVKVNKSLDELRETEFIPFASGIKAGADFVMVGHISLPKVTDDGLPATLSPQIISILRDELDFQGIIITDAFNMGAITDNYSSGEAAVMALEAGIDIVLCPNNLSEAIDGVTNAVNDGIISEQRIDQSVKKILETKIENGIIMGK